MKHGFTGLFGLFLGLFCCVAGAADRGLSVCLAEGLVRHLALILLSYLCWLSLYPHRNPQREREKKEYFSAVFSFILLFSTNWVR